MPTFSNLGKNWYSDTVPENIELHSPLSVQIQANSPMSRKLIYSIVKGNELEEFAVDFNTGMLRFFIFFFAFLSHLKHFLRLFVQPRNFTRLTQEFHGSPLIPSRADCYIDFSLFDFFPLSQSLLFDCL